MFFSRNCLQGEGDLGISYLPFRKFIQVPTSKKLSIKVQQFRGLNLSPNFLYWWTIRRNRMTGTEVEGKIFLLNLHISSKVQVYLL